MATTTKKKRGAKKRAKKTRAETPTPAEAGAPVESNGHANGRADGGPTDEQVRAAVGMPFPHLSVKDQGEAISDFYRHNLAVNEAATEVLRSQGKVDEAKGNLKAAEAHHAQEVKALSACIAEWCEPNLFNQQHKPGANGTLAPSANGDYPPGQPPPAADAWRAERLDLLVPLGGLTQSKLEKLNGIDLVTMGDLADWLKGPPLRNYVDLPGIGPGWVEKIENAMEKFWRDQGYAVNAIAAARAVAAAADGATTDGPPAEDLHEAAVEAGEIMDDEALPDVEDESEATE